MTYKERELLVTIINHLVELLGMDISQDGIGYDNETLDIQSASEDSLEDQLLHIQETFFNSKISVNNK